MCVNVYLGVCYPFCHPLEVSALQSFLAQQRLANRGSRRYTQRSRSKYITMCTLTVDLIKLFGFDLTLRDEH